MPTLDQLYEQDEFFRNTPDIPCIRLVNARQGCSYWGAVAMSLEEWDRRGQIVIDTRDVFKLGGVKTLSEGDEIEIGGVRLLAFESDWASRSWVFLDADQLENHRWFMLKLALRSERNFIFPLLWMMQGEAAWMFPDIKPSTEL